MRVIVIGASLSGKTTLVRFLRENYKNLPISEIDEELTNLNNGEYPEEENKKILAKTVINEVINSDNILFFTNTDYFNERDLKKARKKDFKIVQIEVSLNELVKRNDLRMKKENYPDMGKWLSGMTKYQEKIKSFRLVDKAIDGTKTTEEIANELERVLKEFDKN